MRRERPARSRRWQYDEARYASVWEDEHLNRFEIRGREYAVYRDGGGMESIDARGVRVNTPIKGVETNAEWRPGGGWTISGSPTFIDAKITGNVCGTYVPGTLTPETNCPGPNPTYFADGSVVNGPLAPSGSRLPVVPRFKADVVARYGFTLGDFDAFGQAAYVYQDSSVPLLYPVYYQNGFGNAGPHLGEVPPYSEVNLATGAGKNGMQAQFLISNVFNSLGEIDRFTALAPTTANQPYAVPIQPRTFWLKFGQKF